jgi:hypothetical protein
MCSGKHEIGKEHYLPSQKTWSYYKINALCALINALYCLTLLRHWTGLPPDMMEVGLP